MAAQTLQFLVCYLLAGLAATSPLEPRKLFSRSTSAYAPVYGQPCTGDLIRTAGQGISTEEATYVAGRKKNTNAAFVSWLQQINTQFALSDTAAFDTTKEPPTLAWASSGGGWRALLAGAGVRSGLDSRENAGKIEGLYGLSQTFTYETGLSGASWLLSSIMGNGWQTVSWLKVNQWQNGFNHDLVEPDGSHLKSFKYLDQIKDAVEAKKAAKKDHGQNGTSLTDWWGRFLSYELFPAATQGAINQTLDAIADTDPNSLWGKNEVPFPIFTSMGVNFPKVCLPNSMAIQYEFTPFWTGSWDKGVAAFTPTKYLGTSMNNGKPTDGCTENYANLGYILGSSSTLFNEICTEAQTATGIVPTIFFDALKTFQGGTIETRDEYATYPNPFFGLGAASSVVTNDAELTLADGGETNQNDPIWPLLHRSDVSVMVINDNSADTKDNFVSGSQIYQTYLRAQQMGLDKMPEVPEVALTSQTPISKAQFYGCHDASKAMIIYLPNAQWLDKSVIAANQSTTKQSYTPTETDNMIANAKLTATQGTNNPTWPLCVACATVKNFQTFTGALKDKCQTCFQTYCYNPPGTKPVTLP